MTDHQEDDRRRLAEVLEAYGANPRLWPEEDRARLERHLEHLPYDLRERRQEALRLDRLLDHSGVADVPAGALERLMARADVEASAAPRNRVQAAPRPSRRVLGSPQWAAGLALAASLAIGMYLGAGGMADVLLPIGVEDQGVDGTLVGLEELALIEIDGEGDGQ